MTPEEAINKLNALTDADPETAHVEADRILCQLLQDNGMAEVAKAFKDADERVGFWYA